MIRLPLVPDSICPRIRRRRPSARSSFAASVLLTFLVAVGTAGADRARTVALGEDAELPPEAVLRTGSLAGAGEDAVISAADTVPPAAPTGLTATPIGSSQIDLAWAPPPEGDVAGYQVFLRDSDDAGDVGEDDDEDDEFELIAITGSPQFSATDLDEEEMYHFRVCAFDSAENVSAPSEIASAATAEEEDEDDEDSMEISLITGMVGAGDELDLELNDDEDFEVESALVGRNQVCDWFVTADVGVGADSIQIDYNGNNSARAKQSLYLWNWAKRRWQSIDRAQVGATDVTRSRELGNVARFVSIDGQMRLRILEQFKARIASRCMADMVDFDIIGGDDEEGEEEKAGASTGPNPNGGLATAAGSAPASMDLRKGTAIVGNVASLATRDGDVLVLQSGAGKPRRAYGASGHVTHWLVSATVPDDARSLRVTVIGSTSVGTTQVLYLWSWTSNRWRPISRSHPGPDEMRTVRSIDAAAEFVSSRGEVRLRALTRSRETSFTATVNQVRAEALSRRAQPPSQASPSAREGESAFQILTGTVARSGQSVRFAVRGQAQETLSLFDVRGRCVARLLPYSREGTERLYAWDGRDARGTWMARGVYYARAELRDGSRTQRLVWLRP